MTPEERKKMDNMEELIDATMYKRNKEMFDRQIQNAVSNTMAPQGMWNTGKPSADYISPQPFYGYGNTQTFNSALSAVVNKLNIIDVVKSVNSKNDEKLKAILNNVPMKLSVYEDCDNNLDTTQSLVVDFMTYNVSITFHAKTLGDINQLAMDSLSPVLVKELNDALSFYIKQVDSVSGVVK